MSKINQNLVLNEGFDEFRQRYLVMKGEGSYVAAISIKNIVTGRGDELFIALANAGYDQMLVPHIRTNFLSDLPVHISKGHKIQVVTRVGWVGGSYVYAHETMGRSKRIVRSFGEL